MFASFGWDSTKKDQFGSALLATNGANGITAALTMCSNTHCLIVCGEFT